MVVTSVVAVLAAAAIAATTTTIRTTNNTHLGRILEGPSGFTLYVFCGGTSNRCSGRSVRGWPPLIAHGKVVAARGSHLNASKLSTRRLSNGTHQVTYYGQPLYLYSGDKKPGQTNGEERYSGNGAWFVITNLGRAEQKPGY